jgi:hypothetical protein
MSVVKIKLGANLTEADRRMIKRKLDSEITAIPIKIVNDQIWIGFGPETEELGVWDEIRNYRE